MTLKPLRSNFRGNDFPQKQIHSTFKFVDYFCEYNREPLKVHPTA